MQSATMPSIPFIAEKPCIHRIGGAPCPKLPCENTGRIVIKLLKLLAHRFYRGYHPQAGASAEADGIDRVGPQRILA
jgi:hypothetical protein